MAKIIIKVKFESDDNDTVVEVSTIEQVRKVIRDKKSFIHGFQFQWPMVIRKDTGTVRSSVNTSTWNVKCSRLGIVIYPRPNKWHLPGVFIDWNQIAWVEAAYDTTIDDESYRWWK